MATSEEEQAVSTEEKVGEEVVPGATEGETEKKDDSATSDEEKREEATDTTGEEEAQAETEEKPKKLGGFQRKLRRTQAQLEAAQAEADHWRGQALAKPKATETTTTVEAKPKPKISDFAIKEEDGGGYDHAAFTEELADWKVGQRLAERDAEQQKSQIQTEQQRLGQDFLEREVAFSDSLPENLEEGEGYDEVAGAAIGLLGQLNNPATAEIATAITASDQGPQMLYFLGQNPDELQRIAKLSPKAAVMSLGVIAAKLAENTQEKGQETRTPVVSGAPPPPARIRKPSGARKLRPDDPATAGQMSPEEWLKARRAQVRSRA